MCVHTYMYICIQVYVHIHTHIYKISSKNIFEATRRNVSEVCIKSVSVDFSATCKLSSRVNPSVGRIIWHCFHLDRQNASLYIIEAPSNTSKAIVK